MPLSTLSHFIYNTGRKLLPERKARVSDTFSRSPDLERAIIVFEPTGSEAFRPFLRENYKKLSCWMQIRLLSFGQIITTGKTLKRRKFVIHYKPRQKKSKWKHDCQLTNTQSFVDQFTKEGRLFPVYALSNKLGFVCQTVICFCYHKIAIRVRKVAVFGRANPISGKLWWLPVQTGMFCDQY